MRFSVTHFAIRPKEGADSTRIPLNTFDKEAVSPNNLSLIAAINILPFGDDEVA